MMIFCNNSLRLLIQQFIIVLNFELSWIYNCNILVSYLCQQVAPLISKSWHEKTLRWRVT